MVIEDEQRVAELLQSGLEENGYKVSLAVDGIQGLSLFLKHRFDLVVSDIILPKMCGFEVCKEIRKSVGFYRNLKREAVTKAHLFLTGKVMPSTMQSVYENNKNFLDEVEVAVYRYFCGGINYVKCYDEKILFEGYIDRVHGSCIKCMYENGESG